MGNWKRKPHEADSWSALKTVAQSWWLLGAFSDQCAIGLVNLWSTLLAEARIPELLSYDPPF
jgi:hypothetical protein